MAVPGNLLLRRLLARRPSWKWIKARRGRFTLLSMLVVAGLVGWLTYDLSRPAQLGIWAGVLVFFAFIVRLRWLTFFGPVFLYDLVRSARRSNFAALRSFYAGALLVVLFMVYSSVVRMRGSTFWETLWKPGAVPPESGARFGESVFYTFAAVQFVAVMLLTPVCAAGAITEEKERRTLEFVLTTDLSDR